VFAQVTAANHVLGNRDKRAEYDAYLAEQRRSRSIEDLLEAAILEAQQAAASAEQQARAQQSTPSQPAAASAPPPTSSGEHPAAPAPGSLSGTRPAPTEADIAARREALARRLLAGRAPRATPVAGMPATTSSAPMTKADGMDALKRRYEERIALAKKQKARTYLDQAEAALAQGDLPTAATALRVAADLVPGDADLEKRAHEARRQADGILSETYTKQAQYEEGAGRWADAARSWARVCRAAPSNLHAHVHAVQAILHARGDLHEGARLAQRACELEPNEPKHRVLLGSVYLAAGLSLNARRELDAAAQMAPQDGTIKEMIRRLGAVP
jgi:Flp pilus assembly protein TadD